MHVQPRGDSTRPFKKTYSSTSMFNLNLNFNLPKVRRQEKRSSFLHFQIYLDVFLAINQAFSLQDVTTVVIKRHVS
jgi:hypothetical protein